MGEINLKKPCTACRFSYMEPDSDLICGHKDAGTFGINARIASSKDGHCGPARPKFEQHPLRNTDGGLKLCEEL